MPDMSTQDSWRDLLDDHLNERLQRFETPRHESTIATVEKKEKERQTEKGRPLPRLRVYGLRGFFRDPRDDVEDSEITAWDVIEKSIRVKPNGAMESQNWEHAVTRYFASHSSLARGM